jgi:predicted Zn-ribbon and HTH transcriptional regulator
MELSLNDFVVIIVAGSMLVVAGVSVVSRFLHHRAEARLVGERTVCRLCGHISATDHSGKLSHCKSCGKPNLSRGNGKLG